MSSMLPIIVPSVGKQTASIFFLHGLRERGQMWAPEIAKLKPSYAKLICPNAYDKFVRIHGTRLAAWYDIRPKRANHQRDEDNEGIRKASLEIQTLIETEVRSGISPERIIIGGFSQGGALSLYTGLAGRFPLAGVFSLSGYLPGRDIIDWTNINSPQIFMGHGAEDPILPIDVGYKSRELLEEKCPNSNLRFKSYEGVNHIFSADEKVDVKEFIKEILPDV